MENTIRTQRIHFSILFGWKSDLGLSWRHLRGILGRLGKSFGPSWAPKTPPRCATWAPRRPQDATKTYPRAAQNTSQDALGSPRPPRTSKTSKMTPKSRWGTPRGLVFGAYMGTFGTILVRILEDFLYFILDRCCTFSCFWDFNDPPSPRKLARMTLRPSQLSFIGNPFLKPSWAPNNLARRYLGVSLLNIYIYIYIYIYLYL